MKNHATIIFCNGCALKPLANCGPLQTKASAKCLAKCPRPSANPEAKGAIGPAAILVAGSIGTAWEWSAVLGRNRM